MNTRLKPEARREEILSAAFDLAAKGHYLTLTRNAIAAAVGVSGPAIGYHFSSMDKLRRAVLRAAVAREFLPIIAQGAMTHDRIIMAAPAELRARAVAAVTI